MVTLKGDTIYLRALEPEDLEFVHSIENSESFWELSNTQSPFSKYIIKQYIEHAQKKDIYEAKQLRLVISDYSDDPLGLIDLFDFDFKNKRAGVGILISDSVNRNKGIGFEALQLLINYCFKRLNLKQVYCNISENNEASINLFTSNGFECIGLKKDWNYIDGNYLSEYMYQLIQP